MGEADDIVSLPSGSPPTTVDSSRSRAGLQRYDCLFKVILIGDQSVGKTNLTMRFCEGSCYTPTYVATIGIDFKVKTISVGEKRIKLQIWDTAGQERFKTMSKIFYRGAQGVMFVFDITNRDSFENIRSWIRIYEDVCGESSCDIKKIIVGNKCDEPLLRKVSKDLGEILSRSYGMKYYETSAKLGINVERAFASLAQEILVFQEKRRASELPTTVLSHSKKSASKRSKPSRPWSWSKCAVL